ncbi:glycogen synthase [Patescibacteria group bacterium]|nr:glycogen synthase [Patescibacteria group bacterium]
MSDQKLKIIFASSELTPIAKVGGLGDVAGALPIALKNLGQDIRVIIPKYGVIDTKKYPAEKIINNIPVQLGDEIKKINLWQSKIPGSDVIVYLIENQEFLGDGEIYFEKSAMVGSFFEIKRFLFFSQAVLSIFDKLKWWPDILHCQDWHTGIIPALLKQKKKEDPRFQAIDNVFTIHNLANQGKWDAKEIIDFLKVDYLTPVTNGELNLIQLGILNADLINTVSPTYAQEILTSEHGEGMEKDLQQRKEDLFGIINGIDMNRFNPTTDPDLKVNYSTNNIEEKMANKLELQKLANFKQNTEKPLFGLVSRLTNQKGIELIGEIIEPIVKLGGQFIFLGSGSPQYEKILTEAQVKFKNDVFTTIGFDATLAQKIYAGSDLFLMPSRFEPCGLGQLIAMRYGTLPIVRATGGLKDTVIDAGADLEGGMGFVFEEYNSKQLLKKAQEAVALFKDRDKWVKIMTRGMVADFSWKKSSQEYLKLYQQVKSK